jgi:hypothetical protein
MLFVNLPISKVNGDKIKKLFERYDCCKMLVLSLLTVHK